MLTGIDLWMRTLKIGLPFTLKHKPDYTKLWRKEHCAGSTIPSRWRHQLRPPLVGVPVEHQS